MRMSIFSLFSNIFSNSNKILIKKFQQ
jgi:hypothetical protein